MEQSKLYHKDLAGLLIERLKEIRDDGRLLDFTIYVGDDHIRAHKLILAACSDYFKAMFANNTTEDCEGRVDLKNVEPQTIRAIIDFYYSGQIEITEENFYSLLMAASRFQFKTVQDICEEFASIHLSAANCLGVAILCERCNLQNLSDKAFDCCLEQFESVIEGEEFLRLDENFLAKILSDDRLNVGHEIKVFDAVIEWVKFDENSRLSSLANLMSNVRFALIDPVILVQLTSSDLIRQSLECRDMIDTAKNISLLKGHPELYEQYIGQLNTRPRASLKQQQRLYAVGGWTYEYKSTASAETYDPNTNLWTEISPMIQCRCGVGLTVLDDFIYAVGGHDGRKHLNSVERYDVHKKQWFEDVPNMKYSRTSVGVVTLDGHIYAIGGEFRSAASDKVEKYDPSANEWIECSPMQMKRLGVGVAIHNNFIYVTGGGRGSDSERYSTTNSVERYDPKRDIWEYVAPMNNPRKHHGCCNFRGKLYVVGGRNDPAELDSAEVYDPDLDRWVEIAHMNIKRHGIGLVELADQLYAIGGQSEHSRLNKVEAYDPNTNSWVWKEPMRHGRLGGGMTVHPMRKFLNRY